MGGQEDSPWATGTSSRDRSWRPRLTSCNPGEILSQEITGNPGAPAPGASLCTSLKSSNGGQWVTWDAAQVGWEPRGQGGARPRRGQSLLLRLTPANREAALEGTQGRTTTCVLPGANPSPPGSSLTCAEPSRGLPLCSQDSFHEPVQVERVTPFPAPLGTPEIQAPVLP